MSLAKDLDVSMATFMFHGMSNPYTDIDQKPRLTIKNRMIDVNTKLNLNVYRIRYVTPVTFCQQFEF